MAVQEGAVDRAVVPIENALEGAVAATLDTLATDAAGVRIAAEVVHPIHHCVIAARPHPFGEVTRVVSHPQATAQCARFLRDRLPHADLVTAPSTADAVLSLGTPRSPRWRSARGWRPSCTAARCSRPTWRTTPTTPPASSGSRPPRPPSSPARTGPRPRWSSGAAATCHRAGWWACWASSAGRGVNLTRIESRPRRIRLGHYMFFADLEGAAERPPVSDALAALRRRVEEVRVLGSYTRAGGRPSLNCCAPWARTRT